MRIAISACADGWKEEFEERFGRANGFFIYDTDTKETSYIDNNTNVEAAHGAGTRAAQSLAEAGVRVVITGRVGPKAGAVLKAAGVKVMIGSGLPLVEDACRHYEVGCLREQSL